MKKIVSLVLSLVMLLSLGACAAQPAESTAASAAAVTDDTEFVITKESVAEPPDGGGMVIAFAADGDGVQTGANAAAWMGVQKFAENFNFNAQAFVAADDSTIAAADTLRQAAESGASIVICRGPTMAAALYNIQDNYPSVSYLLLDGEPHSADYVTYKTNANVHCVLFQEEQAGFLAGYAAVMEGYNNMGFVGAEQLPGYVRYCTGFLQGVEYASELQGIQVRMKIWYCGVDQANSEVENRVLGWYNDGVQLVLACGGTLAESCVAAAEQTGGKVIAAEWEQGHLGEEVLGSAVECYSTVVQQQLLKFYTSGTNSWDSGSAGQTENVGYSTAAVGLAGTNWRFRNFTQEQYAELYEKLRNSVIKVERYSDADNLPATTNIAIDIRA